MGHRPGTHEGPGQGGESQPRVQRLAGGHPCCHGGTDRRPGDSRQRHHQPERRHHHGDASEPEPVIELAIVQYHEPGNRQFRPAVVQRHCRQPHRRHACHPLLRPAQRQWPGLPDQSEWRAVRRRIANQRGRPGGLDARHRRCRTGRRDAPFQRQRHGQHRQPGHDQCRQGRLCCLHRQYRQQYGQHQRGSGCGGAGRGQRRHAVVFRR